MNVRLELRKFFRGNAFHVLNITNGTECSMLLAVSNNALSQHRPDSRQTPQLLRRTAINIDLTNVSYCHGWGFRQMSRRRINLSRG